MNDQALAILSGAVAQLNALETSTQALIDADTSDVADQTAAAAAVAATAQAKIDADNAAIATSQTGLTAQKSITDALTALIAQYTVAPVVVA